MRYWDVRFGRMGSWLVRQGPNVKKCQENPISRIQKRFWVHRVSSKLHACTWRREHSVCRCDVPSIFMCMLWKPLLRLDRKQKGIRHFPIDFFIPDRMAKFLFNKSELHVPGYFLCNDIHLMHTCRVVQIWRVWCGILRWSNHGLGVWCLTSRRTPCRLCCIFLPSPMLFLVMPAHQRHEWLGWVFETQERTKETNVCLLPQREVRGDCLSRSAHSMIYP